MAAAAATSAPRRASAASCEASLRRLGVERIDLYQMHWPAEDGTPIEEYWQTLLDLKAEGKVRAVGLSNHDVAQLDGGREASATSTRCSRRSRPSGASSPRPSCRGASRTTPASSSTARCRPACSPARSPPSAPSGCRPTTGARATPSSPAHKLKANLALAETMQAVGERHGTSAAAAAIAWTLAWPGVTGAIVGAREPSQVDGWIDAAHPAPAPGRPRRDRRRPSSAPAPAPAPPCPSRWRANAGLKLECGRADDYGMPACTP